MDRRSFFSFAVALLCVPVVKPAEKRLAMMPSFIDLGTGCWTIDLGREERVVPLGSVSPGFAIETESRRSAMPQRSAVRRPSTYRRRDELQEMVLAR